MSRKLTIPACASAFALMLAAGAVLAPHVSQAANARQPYANVNHGNDAGNDTGDSQVDRLNDMQLNRNYHGPVYYQGQPPATQNTPVMPPK